MKLGTIVSNGQWRTVILTRRPDDQTEVLIDIAAAVAVLHAAATAGRLHWITGWSGPWGQWVAPTDMLDIVRYGRASVVALQELETHLWNYARSSDGGWAETVLLDPQHVVWQAPIPEPPVYFYLHNNSTLGLNFQFTKYGRRAMLHPRNRPITTIIGTHEPLYADDQGNVSSDMEFGFVVGPEAELVDDMQAMDHVFGYTVCTDSSVGHYRSQYNALGKRGELRHITAGALMDKASDGYGGWGPVIVTADEVGNPHDLLGHIYINGIHRGRSYTGSYLDTVRDVLANLSHLLTVPAGTLVAMGAAGYDGFGAVGELRQPGHNSVAIEFERVGKLTHPVIYPDEPEAIDRSHQSPYLHRREKLGLPSCRMPDLAPSDIPAVTRSVWALSHNVDDPVGGKCPTPFDYPRSSLASANDPIDLPPPRRDVEISVQLAAVVGPQPLYGVKADQALEGLLGLAMFIGIADLEILHRGEYDPVISSAIFAYHMSRFPDGFNRVANPVPLDQLAGDWAQSAMELEIECIGTARASVADYSCSIQAMVEWVSERITLLPGDVLSLGPSRASLRVPFEPGSNHRLTVRTSITGLPVIETWINDRRDASVPSWHPLKIRPPAGESSLEVNV